MFANRTFCIASLAVIAYALICAFIDGFFPGMILSKGTMINGVWLMTLGLFIWGVRLHLRGKNPMHTRDDDEPPRGV